MNPQVKELLKPEILNTVDGLELIAKIIVEGFMSGSNKSDAMGAGQEFSQYRSYEPGDDLRQLDWKMFARSERYYIKQSEIETNITVNFMLDASRSMAYDENGVTKLEYAKVVIASLAYLARKQSDAIGLFSVNDRTIHAVQPRFEQQQFLRFLNELIRIKSEGSWQKNHSPEHLYRHQNKEMIVFLTDLYDDRQDLQRFIARLKTPRNEVIVFHLLGRRETDLDFPGAYTFEDLETGERIMTDPLAQRKTYTVAVHDWIQDVRNSMLARQINYHRVTMDEPVDQVLRNFLNARKALTQ
jgi:uncharacterized protein (DUF58 family)